MWCVKKEVIVSGSGTITSDSKYVVVKSIRSCVIGRELKGRGVKKRNRLEVVSWVVVATEGRK